MPKPKIEDTHWMLKTSIVTFKYLTLFKCLPNKLTTTNYISWMFSVEAMLDTINLLGYLTSSVAMPGPKHKTYENWQTANVLVHFILITNMLEEVQVADESSIHYIRDLEGGKALFVGADNDGLHTHNYSHDLDEIC
jgi:hypothetical protein